MSEIETAEATDRVMAVLNYWFDGCARIDRNSEMVAQLAALAARPVSHGGGFSALQAQAPSVPICAADMLRLNRLRALVENDECHWNMDGPPESDCVDVLVSDLRAVLSLIQATGASA
jgi:hypothetical protein